MTIEFENLSIDELENLSIDELGDKEINDFENIKSVMALKFECPEIEEIIQSLGEGHTPYCCKVLKNLTCNKVPGGEKCKALMCLIIKLFDKFSDETINKLFSPYAPLKWFLSWERLIEMICENKCLLN